jgi:acetyltransferase AlgX (SGNH hydrolase-like protein)
MKKFIFKTLVFVLPAFISYVAIEFFYTSDKGDLIRIGYIVDRSDYRDIFIHEFDRNIYFTNISTINLRKQNKFKVLTIGDSFSEQGGFGYKNYLANEDSISLIHFDRIFHINPIQALYGIINGDILDNLKVDYIILQSIEREFTRRALRVDTNKILNIDSIHALIKKPRTNHNKVEKVDKFFSDRIIKFPLYNLLYLIKDNAYISDIYRVETRNELFTNKKNELLFHKVGIERTVVNNNVDSVFRLNKVLNGLSEKLNEKGIKLIVLPSPDKYDFYYDCIVDNSKYPTPLFFEHFEKMSKEYLYVDSKNILMDRINRMKDIYFYDDTHWSPWSAQIISKELVRIINGEKSVPMSTPTH